MTKLSAIICDIDGTVANHEGIRGHYEYEKVSLDLPKTEIIDLVTYYLSARESAKETRELLMLTGRPDTFEVRRDTTHWLYDNGIYFTKLIMRPEFLTIDFGSNKAGSRDYRPDYLVKKELYYEYVEPFYDVDIVFDDRKQVVDMWRREGLTCLQVAEGNF